MKKILIVDDEEINRMTLEAGFTDLFEIKQAVDGDEALDCLYFDEQIECVLLDINMPVCDGFQVLRTLNENGLIEKIPVFIVTSESDDEQLIKAYELGAADVISKPYNIQFLRRRVVNTIELYEQRNRLSGIVEEKTRELVRQNNRLVEAMADVVEFRSNESGTHVKRVSGYTKIIMEEIINEFPEYKELRKDIESISFAACLHDLGKIAIPDSILNKPGKLTPEEFDVMKSHSIHGYEQILTLKDIMEPKLFEYSLDITRHHHERYDGRGYPDRLVGEDISIWSQAVAISDVYDALTSERCYKRSFDHQTACQMLLSGECGAFNPKIIKVFTKYKEKFNQLRLGISRKKVLVVDDSEIDRSTLKTILFNKYDVAEFESGLLAFSHLRSNLNEYDAIIVDVYMPNMDGFDLLMKLGRDFISKTPVIMCSVDVNSEIISKAANFGVRAFIRKPFDYDTVMNKVSLFTKD